MCLVLGKLKSWGYHMLKKVWWCIKPFWYNTGTWQTDGQTDDRTDGRNSYISITRLRCCVDGL